MTNEELVEHVRDGDAGSIEKLIRNNQEYLYKLARRLSNNPGVIEDLVQEAALQFWMPLGVMSRSAAHCS